MSSSDPRAVVAVIQDLEVGGTPRLYIDILRRMRARGVRVRLIAADGPLAELARAADVELHPVDWSRRRGETYAAVAAASEGFDAGLVACYPSTLHAVTGVHASCGRLLLGIHSEVHALAAWFSEPELARLKTLARALARTNSTGVVARGAPHARDCASLLGVEPPQLEVVLPGIATDAIEFDPGGGEPGAVLVLSRLDPDSAPRVRAGVELVRAGLELGRPCRLEIVGDGTWRDGALAHCREALPETSWRIEAPVMEPIARVRRASVVVASGLTVLEAAAAGRPVVVARRSNGGGSNVGPLLTPETFGPVSQDVHAVSHAPGDPARLWEELDALDPKALEDVRSLVERHNSSEAQASAFVGTLASLRRGEAGDPLLLATGAITASLVDEAEQARRTADELWRTRELPAGGDGDLKSAPRRLLGAAAARIGRRISSRAPGPES